MQGPGLLDHRVLERKPFVAMSQKKIKGSKCMHAASTPFVKMHAELLVLYHVAVLC